jgi:hypothetical protein
MSYCSQIASKACWERNLFDSVNQAPLLKRIRDLERVTIDLAAGIRIKMQILV